MFSFICNYHSNSKFQSFLSLFEYIACSTEIRDKTRTGILHRFKDHAPGSEIQEEPTVFARCARSKLLSVALRTLRDVIAHFRCLLTDYNVRDVKLNHNLKP